MTTDITAKVKLGQQKYTDGFQLSFDGQLIISCPPTFIYNNTIISNFEDKIQVHPLRHKDYSECENSERANDYKEKMREINIRCSNKKPKFKITNNPAKQLTS